jgi:hypothetical protein
MLLHQHVMIKKQTNSLFLAPVYDHNCNDVNELVDEEQLKNHLFLNQNVEINQEYRHRNETKAKNQVDTQN